MESDLTFENSKCKYMFYLTTLGQEYKSINFSDENFANLYVLTKMLFECIMPLYGSINELESYIYGAMIPSLGSITECKKFVLSTLEYLGDIARHYSGAKLSLSRLAVLGASEDIISFIRNYMSYQKNVINSLNVFLDDNEKVDISSYQNNLNDFYFLQAEIHRIYSILLSKARDNVIIIDTTLK